MLRVPRPELPIFVIATARRSHELGVRLRGVVTVEHGHQPKMRRVYLRALRWAVSLGLAASLGQTSRPKVSSAGKYRRSIFSGGIRTSRDLKLTTIRPPGLLPGTSPTPLLRAAGCRKGAASLWPIYRAVGGRTQRHEDLSGRQHGNTVHRLLYHLVDGWARVPRRLPRQREHGHVAASSGCLEHTASRLNLYCSWSEGY